VSLAGLVNRIAASAALRQFVDDLLAGALPEGCALPRAARPFLAAALFHATGKPLIYVTASVDASRIMADALGLLTGNEALRFAEPNTAFYDTIAPVRSIIAQRSAALAALVAAAPPALIVASPRALMHPTLAPKRAALGGRVIQMDQTLALEQTVAHWLSLGYENEQVVERIGAFSRRGGIIDIWPPAESSPVRIELFGNTVDSIRHFDPGTQRSGATLKRIQISALDVIAEDAGDGAIGSLIAHLPEGGLLIIDDGPELQDAWRALEEKAARELATLSVADDSDGETGDTLAPGNTAAQAQVRSASRTQHPFVTWEAFRADAEARHALALGQHWNVFDSPPHPIARRFQAAPHFAGQLNATLDYLGLQRDAGATVVVSRQSARIADLWSAQHSPLAAQTSLADAPAPGVSFVINALPGGFIWSDDGGVLTVLTDAEIFGLVKPESSYRGKVRKSAPEKAFADWRPGDAVVHEDYGVGLFRGLVKLTVNTGTPVTPQEGEREYLLLEYADADRLYVPLHQLDRVQRYVGGEDDKPRLDKLHSGEWERHKSKARGAAADIAREMLKLYAAREVARGHAFARDGAWQTELESSFAFVETEDQLSAIQAVKADMELSTPMDRLIVGDVGFGKTEVALRAAFKAAQDGKQVAVLVPTTVLAQQHWSTFSKRLASFPLSIEMHSRFRTAAEKREIVDKLADGSIDIVIGTHGLVADKIKFKDLGLLIIDEEHRFGVTAKEKLKKLRTEVDVLTLTATPIPRTLYLGLSGVRAISKIETPPAERLPIINYVGAWEDVVVQQAIRRELDRDGQIFLVHNRIHSIDLLAQKIARLAPEARMAVAHGQMDERELAKIMVNFAEGRVDLLLCTNIIESGLDIPNANTILIDNADHFGLAELHQLRGRVGRSTIQAYAYFLHDRRGRMTAEARERLETLRETAGIGAGYSISMRDLEMRGAGDMLGPKQSGHIASVGFDLYTRLLAHEVSTLRALRDGVEPPPPEPKPVVIDLPLTIGLPESYINDDALRVQLYRRVASMQDEAQVQAFEEELTDRFGKLPPAALNMTYQVRLKLLSLKLGASAITTEGNRFTIRAEPLEALVPQVGRVQRMLGEDALIGRKQVSFLRKGTPEAWKQRLKDVIVRLTEMVEAAR
jgi:transcription-repair coupling factor (superfamily II helicase)